MRVFISYKRGAEPDEKLALAIEADLRRHHHIFIDQRILLGAQWARQIQEELEATEVFIVLLSEASVHSEMVEAEVATAHRLWRQGDGRPLIIPIRVAYAEPLDYPLSAYLDPLQWGWCSELVDAPPLLEAIRRAMAGDTGLLESTTPVAASPPLPALPPALPSAQPLLLETGTLPQASPFYIARQADRLVLEAIAQPGVTITIKGPRQVGKSSLLVRVMQAAPRWKKRVAFLDFQLLDQAAFADPERFFRHFCSWLALELGVEARLEEYWGRGIGPVQACSLFCSERIVGRCGTPITLVMDEVDRVFGAPFRSDFFGMLRHWHNNRRVRDSWDRLDLVLASSTEPYLFITDLNQSPFNVGEVVELADFDERQVGDLNRLHGSPASADDLGRLFSLLGGQPFLMRRALYLLAMRRLTATQLFAQAAEDGGPFGDHLRRHLLTLHRRMDLVRGLLDVIRNGRCDDEEVFFRLRGAGLVRREGRELKPRCQLYADYFPERLRG